MFRISSFANYFNKIWRMIKIQVIHNFLFEKLLKLPIYILDFVIVNIQILHLFDQVHQ